MKKVLNVSIVLFVVALILTFTKVYASVSLTFNDVKVPALQGTYISGSRAKVSFDTVQCTRKAWAKDSLTGSARSIDAKVHGQTAGTSDSSWLTTTTSNKNLGAAVTNPGSYVMYLRATTSAITAIQYQGYWGYDAVPTSC